MKVLSILVVLIVASGIGAFQEPDEKEQIEPRWVIQTKASLALPFAPPSQFEKDWEILPFQSIRLIRTGPGGDTEGFYPDYEILLSAATKESAEALGTNSLGPIRYIGQDSVEMIGERMSAVTYGDYARLCLLAEEIDLVGGMKTYSKKSDLDPNTKLEILLKSGETIIMSEWGWQAPVGVWAFCCSIDKIWADRINEAR